MAQSITPIAIARAVSETTLFLEVSRVGMWALPVAGGLALALLALAVGGLAFAKDREWRG